MRKKIIKLLLRSLFLGLLLIVLSISRTTPASAQDYGKAWQECSVFCGWSYCNNKLDAVDTKSETINYSSYGITAQNCTYHSWKCVSSGGPSCNTGDPVNAGGPWAASCDKTYANRLATGAGASADQRCAPPAPGSPTCKFNNDDAPTAYVLGWDIVPGLQYYNVYSGSTTTTKLASPTTNSYTTTNLSVRTFTITSVGGGRESTVNSHTGRKTLAITTCPALPCTPITQCTDGKVCGTIPDGCGGTVTCGTCTTPTTKCSDDQKSCICPTAGDIAPHYKCENNICTKDSVCGTNQCTSADEGKNCIPTTLSLTIGLDGIGTTGDEVNPSAWQQVTGQTGTGSNFDLKTKNTPVPIKAILIDTSSNKHVFDSTVSFDNDETHTNTYGKFLTTTPISLNSLAAGSYTIQASISGYLLGDVPGIITVPGTINAQSVRLVVGDITGVTNNPPDLSLTLEDYGVLISCMTDLSLSVDNHEKCQFDADFQKLSDLEDNGVIDQYDYNLWLREFSIQHGD